MRTQPLFGAMLIIPISYAISRNWLRYVQPRVPHDTRPIRLVRREDLLIDNLDDADEFKSELF